MGGRTGLRLKALAAAAARQERNGLNAAAITPQMIADLCSVRSGKRIRRSRELHLIGRGLMRERTWNQPQLLTHAAFELLRRSGTGVSFHGS